MSRKLTLMGLSLVGLAVVAGTWRLHAYRVQSVAPAVTVPTLSALGMRDGPVSSSVMRPAVTVDPRAERKKATDYRQLVNRLLPLAKAGSAAAQYEVASALHYCDENVHLLISAATGAVRTPEEIRQLDTKLPENTQSLVEEAHQRCDSFMGDLSFLKTSSDWLDQAAKAGYPPATFMKADLTMRAHLMDGDAAAVQQAREQAISASTSGDATVLFGMAEFVDGADKSLEQAGQLISAWWLLACESGYDCGPESDAIKNICTVDPQCANRPSVVENLELMNGAKFGEVQQLAEQIRAAVQSGDPAEIKKYL